MKKLLLLLSALICVAIAASTATAGNPHDGNDGDRLKRVFRVTGDGMMNAVDQYYDQEFLTHCAFQEFPRNSNVERCVPVDATETKRWGDSDCTIPVVPVGSLPPPGWVTATEGQLPYLTSLHQKIDDEPTTGPIHFNESSLCESGSTGLRYRYGPAIPLEDLVESQYIHVF